MINTKKGKVLGITLISLAAVSMASVGFSAWIVQALNPTDAQSISLAVADTVDKSITLAVTGTPELNVTFDAESGDSAGDITASSTAVDLVFGFTFTVTVGDDATDVPSTVDTIVPTFDALAGLTSAITANYVVAPITSGTALSLPSGLAAATYYDGSTTSKDDFKQKFVVVATSVKVYTITATFQFLWGSYFGGVNPSLCDSAMTPTAYNGHTVAEIKAALGTLKTDLNGKTIANLKLNPTAQ